MYEALILTGLRIGDYKGCHCGTWLVWFLELEASKGRLATICSYKKDRAET